MVAQFAGEPSSNPNQTHLDKFIKLIKLIKVIRITRKATVK